MNQNLLWTVALLGLAGCAKADPVAPPGGRPPLRYGAVMSEVGRRFELAGRAAAAQRFELALFEVSELEEALEEDLPRASLPREGTPENLSQLTSFFVATGPGALKAAARAHDGHGFAAAYAAAAALCNACHQASAHGFVEIAATMGTPVPDVSPVIRRGAPP